jgi:hypothetical protein
MRLLSRVLQSVALVATLAAVTPALAETKKVVISQAFQSML